MDEKKGRIRVMISKINSDGHWRGPLLVSQALRDAGMEVIYTDALSPEEIVQTAVQESVDVIGLNIGIARYEAMQKMMRIFDEKGVEGILIVAGGVIPREDIPKLKEMGVAEVFPPGSSLKRIVDFIVENVGKEAIN